MAEARYHIPAFRRPLPQVADVPTGIAPPPIGLWAVMPQQPPAPDLFDNPPWLAPVLTTVDRRFWQAIPSPPALPLTSDSPTWMPSGVTSVDLRAWAPGQSQPAPSRIIDNQAVWMPVAATPDWRAWASWTRPSFSIPSWDNPTWLPSRPPVVDRRAWDVARATVAASLIYDTAAWVASAPREPQVWRWSMSSQAAPLTTPSLAAPLRSSDVMTLWPIDVRRWVRTIVSDWRIWFGLDRAIITPDPARIMRVFERAAEMHATARPSTMTATKRRSKLRVVS